MGPTTVYVLIAILGGAAWKKASEKKKKVRGMTAERTQLYNIALKSKDAKKLRAVADIFEKQDDSLKPQVEMLRKRAALRELPEEQKAARREAFRKGMRSLDPDAIMKLASANESVGASAAAAALRKYAKGLRLSDPVAIEALATEFEKGGENEALAAIGLRKRADDLKKKADDAKTEPAQAVQ